MAFAGLGLCLNLAAGSLGGLASDREASGFGCPWLLARVAGGQARGHRRRQVDARSNHSVVVVVCGGAFPRRCDLLAPKRFAG